MNSLGRGASHLTRLSTSGVTTARNAAKVHHIFHTSSYFVHKFAPYWSRRVNGTTSRCSKHIGEGHTATGGVEMQETTRTQGRKRSEIAHGIAGIALFLLLMGFWAHLWVQPLPVF